MSYTDYKLLPRTLYGLYFRCEHAVYIGQTRSTRRRFAEHRASGDWNNLEAFEPLALATYECTRAGAEEHEYAWRMAAKRAGWRVYGGSKFGRPYCVDPFQRSNPERLALLKACRWREPRRSRTFFGKAKLFTFSVLALWILWRLFSSSFISFLIRP